MDSKNKDRPKNKQAPFDFNPLLSYSSLGSMFPGLNPQMMSFFPHSPDVFNPSLGDNADWWKMTSEQAKKMVEEMSSVYMGLNGFYGGNPLLNSMYPAGFPPSQPLSRIPSTPSPGIFSHQKSVSSTPDGASNSTKHPSNNSSPIISKDPSQKRSDSARSVRTRTDSESSTILSPKNPSESSTPIKQFPTDSFSKESALFPNPFMLPFGGFGAMPFANPSMYSDYLSSFSNFYNKMQDKPSQKTNDFFQGVKEKYDSDLLNNSSASYKNQLPIPGTSARTLTIHNHRQLKNKHENIDKNKKLKPYQKTFQSSDSMNKMSDYLSQCQKLSNTETKVPEKRKASDNINYSQDGAIDLSVKKSRSEAFPKLSHDSKQHTNKQSKPEAADILSALAQSHHMLSSPDAMNFAVMFPQMYNNFYNATKPLDLDDKKSNTRKNKRKGDGKGKNPRSTFISHLIPSESADQKLPLDKQNLKNKKNNNEDNFEKYATAKNADPINNSKFNNFSMPYPQQKYEYKNGSKVEEKIDDCKDKGFSSGIHYNAFFNTSELSDKNSEKSCCSDDNAGEGDYLNNRNKWENTMNLLKIPLERGWKRETKIELVDEKGIVGSVEYTNPCNMKVLDRRELEQYLVLVNPDSLNRIHFSFNTNVKLGTFYEKKNDGNTTDYVEISKERTKEIFEKVKQSSVERRRLRKEQLNYNHYNNEEHNKISSSYSLLDQLKNYNNKEMNKSRFNKNYGGGRDENGKVDWSHGRNDYDKTRSEMFGSRELSYYSFLFQNAFANQNKHKNNGQKTPLQLSLERERRRHYLLLVKAIDARRKDEEREKMREERRNFKKVGKEKRQEHRRQEVMKMRMMKKPVEDMTLEKEEPLTNIHRLNTSLEDKVFADSLMLLEFVHNFYSCLKLGQEQLPTIEEIQNGLIGCQIPVSFAALIISFVKLCIEDPGFPNSREAVTQSGMKLADVDIDMNNVSEVMRVYIKAKCGKTNEMAEWLTETPFQALTPSQKTNVLSFLCHELLSGKTITGEIDRSIDEMAVLRKDKWLIEGKLRKLRMLQAIQLRKNSMSRNLPPTPVKDPLDTIATTEKKDEDDDDEDESHDDDTSHVHESENEEDEHLSLEELEAKIDKLAKQYTGMQERTGHLSTKLTTPPLGSDRFRRLYWLLPRCGGVLVEGVKTGDSNAGDNGVKAEGCGKGGSDDGGSVKVKSESCDAAKVKEENKIIEKCKLEENIKQNGDTTEGKFFSETCKNETKPLKENSEHFQNSDSSPEKLNKKTENLKADTNKSETLNNTMSPQKANSTDLKDTIKEAEDARNSYITNLEDIITRTVMDSMNEEDDMWSNPPFSKQSQILSDFLVDPASNENKAINKIEIPSNKIDEIEMTKKMKRLHFSLDRGMWFSVFNNRNSCTSYSENSLLHLPFASFDHIKEMYGGMGSRSSSPLPMEPCTEIPSIPPDLQNGWWAVREKEELNTLLKSLNQRGVREKVLAKSLEKNYQLICQSFKKTTGNVLSWNSDGKLTPQQNPSEELSTEPNLSSNVQTPSQQQLPFQHQQQQIESQQTHSHQQPQIQQPSQFQQLQSQQIEEQTTQQPIVTQTAQQQTDLQQTSQQTNLQTPQQTLQQTNLAEPNNGSLSHESSSSSLLRIQQQTLKVIENFHEKISNASLQGWKAKKAKEEEEDSSVMDKARKKLLKLESSIERRYLKPPFGPNVVLSLNNRQNQSHHESASEEDDNDDDGAGKELLAWRKAVTMATNPSQLCILVQQLNKNISWEKSIMRVTCQICRKDDNEGELLLCDLCDHGYHTYCVKPKLQAIPDGDWYCQDCMVKASQNVSCVVCGKQAGRMITCITCKRKTHIACFDPPVARTTKKWYCNLCVLDKIPSKKRMNKQLVTPSSSPSSSSVSSSPFHKKTESKSCVLPNETTEENNYSYNDVYDKNKDINNNTNVDNSLNKNINNNNININNVNNNGDNNFSQNVYKKRNMDIENDKGKAPNITPPLNSKHNTEWNESAQMPFYNNQGHPSMDFNSRKLKMKEDSATSPQLHDLQNINNNGQPMMLEKIKIDLKKKFQEERNAKRLLDNNDDVSNPPTNGISSCKEDFFKCQTVLSELKKHEEAWPFLTPVNNKQFPTYKRVVRSPIDFQTISKRLKTNYYKNTEEFVTDTRLVFENCKKFNDDDSLVGKAGYHMNEFFEKRWAELNNC